MNKGKCESHVLDLLERNTELKKILSDRQISPTISCRPCAGGAEAGAKAFLMSNPMEIVLCTNRLRNSDDVEVALTHETMHLFDAHHNRCDFGTCEGLAYSEVRAARQAECKGFFPFEFFRERCIKNHATKSTANIFPRNARDCVDQVYETAMKDSEPQI